MAASGRDFQSALYILLPFDFGKIDFIIVLLLKNFRDIDFERADLGLALEKTACFT